jgi:hypothetical protein
VRSKSLALFVLGGLLEAARGQGYCKDELSLTIVQSYYDLRLAIGGVGVLSRTFPASVYSLDPRLLVNEDNARSTVPTSAVIIGGEICFHHQGFMAFSVGQLLSSDT